MSLIKYLNYIEKITKGSVTHFPRSCSISSGIPYYLLSFAREPAPLSQGFQGSTLESSRKGGCSIPLDIEQLLFRRMELSKKNLFYAKIAVVPRKSGLNPPCGKVKDTNLYFEVSDKRLEYAYPTENISDDKLISSLIWINTRNRFSMDILKSLLHYQSKYWFSGKETDLKPLTLKQFLSLYPLQYLDQTRLSRLIPNLLVISPHNQTISLRDLFISKKKYHSYLIKEIVNNAVVPRKSGLNPPCGNENALKDKDIQYLLHKKGIHLSLRTICNCRRLVNIPNYKEKDAYYARDIAFSDFILLSKKYFNKIPNEAGVYELSISSKINYLNHRTNVIYIGSSVNLRKRLINYSGEKLKNNLLNKLINNHHHDVYVRFYLTEDYVLMEKRLFKIFKNKYGTLPKANSLGG